MPPLSPPRTPWPTVAEGAAALGRVLSEYDCKTDPTGVDFQCDPWLAIWTGGLRTALIVIGCSLGACCLLYVCVAAVGSLKCSWKDCKEVPCLVFCCPCMMVHKAWSQRQRMEERKRMLDQRKATEAAQRKREQPASIQLVGGVELGGHAAGFAAAKKEFAAARSPFAAAISAPRSAPRSASRSALAVLQGSAKVVSPKSVAVGVGAGDAKPSMKEGAVPMGQAVVYAPSSSSSSQIARVSSRRATDCVVCMDAAATHALVPCGHKCVCESCASRLSTCPTCRTPVQAHLRIFNS